MYLDHTDIASLLDILGNKNRRRIIDLLRVKPCYVTEISQRLTVSPKAVIDHLQMLEQADILRFRLDKHRRKYYYLSNDISITVDLKRQEQAIVPLHRVENLVLHDNLVRLQNLVSMRDELERRIEHLDMEIDNQIGQIARTGSEMGEGDLRMMVAISLVFGPQDEHTLASTTGAHSDDVRHALHALMEQGIVHKKGIMYQIRGPYAK
ncbi:MAG: ArsR family transcriptional regulator [Methanospirillaceae archaeon]|nr:ArsR family transcriptional regulator [Methanospirillaceae archaeon]